MIVLEVLAPLKAPIEGFSFMILTFGFTDTCQELDWAYGRLAARSHWSVGPQQQGVRPAHHPRQRIGKTK